MNSYNQPTLESDIMARILRRGGSPDIVPGTENLTQATTAEVIHFLTFTDPTALRILAQKNLTELTKTYDTLLQTVSPEEIKARFIQLASIEYPPYGITSESGLGEFKEFQARVRKILSPDSEKLAA